MAVLRAIIFDCDGILVDTEHLKFQAWQKALEAHGISFTIDEYMPLIGGSSIKIMAAIATLKNLSINQTDLISQKNSIYKSLQSQGVKPINDAINFLKQLISTKNEHSIKLGLASSASRDEIYENLKQIGIDPEQFDQIVSGSDDLKDIQDSEGTNKPKPYIYTRIATKLSVNPSDCLVFEDSGAGVIAAADAGMIVIAVPDQFTQKHDFSKANMQSTFNSLTVDTLKRIMDSRQSSNSTQKTFMPLAAAANLGNNITNDATSSTHVDSAHMPKV